MNTVLGFIDESGTISEIFKKGEGVASFTLLLFKDEEYINFKKEWLETLRELFKKIFDNIAKEIGKDPLKLYEVEEILNKAQPRMELHTTDLLHHEYIYKYLDIGTETEFAKRFCDIILNHVSSIYVLIVTKKERPKSTSRLSRNTKCNDNEVSTAILMKFVDEVVIKKSNLTNDLFIIVIDGESYASAQGGGRYNCSIVNELLRRRYFGERPSANRLGLSVFFAPSHHEAGIQGADLIAFIARRYYKERLTHNTDKNKNIIIESFSKSCFEGLKEKGKLKVFRMALGSCDREEILKESIEEE